MVCDRIATGDDPDGDITIQCRVRFLKIGILGMVKIARSFVAGVKLSQQVSVAAVASRDTTRAREFAQEPAIARHFGCYESLLAARDIDAVYILLPHCLHAEWAINTVLAGNHMLCEKPLAAAARTAA